MVFYFQEKEGSGQPTHSFWSWLIKTFFCSPNQKMFYIVVISFQSSLLEEEIYIIIPDNTNIYMM